VTASDNFTVVFQFKAGTNPLLIENILQATGTSTNSIENPELIAAYTTAASPVMADWHHAVGTGAFTLTDLSIAVRLLTWRIPITGIQTNVGRRTNFLTFIR